MTNSVYTLKGHFGWETNNNNIFKCCFKIIEYLQGQKWIHESSAR